MLNAEKVKAMASYLPESTPLELAEYWCDNKEEVIDFLRIYQDFIGPIE